MFAGFLVFDAWIANTDRHAENWAVLTCKRNGRRTLAASFDHGSALASGSQDEQLETADVEQFVTNRDRGWERCTLSRLE